MANEIETLNSCQVKPSQAKQPAQCYEFEENQKIDELPWKRNNESLNKIATVRIIVHMIV